MTHLKQQIQNAAIPLGDQSKGLAASDIALSRLTQKTTGKAGSSAALKVVDNTSRFDRITWRTKAMAIGKVPRAQTASALSTLMLPAVLPWVRRDVHKAISQYHKAPADLLELLFQDITLATIVLAGTHFEKYAACDKASKLLPEHLKKSVFTSAIARIRLENICESLDDVEVDAAPMTKLIEPWLAKWWRHAIAVSQLSGELAVVLEVDADLARMAGFFHDIGRLTLLASNLGPKLITAYEYCSRMDIPTAYAEQTLLGKDHHQAGAAYCTRWKLPLAIHNICGQHDLTDIMREQLDVPSQRLSAVVSAANEIAKASGIGSLPDDEIRPLPHAMKSAAGELSSVIEQCLAQVQTMCHWRTGNSGVTSMPLEARLDGKLIVIVSPTAGAWHPVALVLKQAGARVNLFTDIKQVTFNCPISDLMLLDFTDSSLHLSMPVLTRLIKAPCFNNIPKLLLADAAEEPCTRIKQSGLNVSVQPTPIRSVSLVTKISQLLT